MHKRDVLAELISLIIVCAFWYGPAGAIAGGIWASALGFGFGIGALWGGAGLFVAGVLFGCILSATGRLGEKTLFGRAVIIPFVGVTVIGVIVLIIRDLF